VAFARLTPSRYDFLRWWFVGTVAFLVTAPARAHDLERTQVSIVFARDGSFVVDVANDLEWLKLRLPPFASGTGPVSLAALGPVFVDRVVLFVDGHEVRPTSAEYIPPRQQVPGDEFPMGTYRLRGRLPLDAHTLRWYYGLVIDPYPLTIRRADGRTTSETVYGDAWSRTIDVSGQFTRTTDIWLWVIVGLFVIGLSARIVGSLRRGHENAKARKRGVSFVPSCLRG
jgi:hypothetical protein